MTDPGQLAGLVRAAQRGDGLAMAESAGLPHIHPHQLLAWPGATGLGLAVRV